MNSGRFLVVPAFVAMVGVLSADTLIHRDGRMFDGVDLKVQKDSVMVFFEHGNVQVPLEDVLEILIDGGGGFVPKTEEERKRFAKGQVRYKGKWMSKKSRDSRAAKDLLAMRAAVEERKSGRLWRNRELVETKNFIFESTAPPNVSKYYRELSEAYFQEFAKTWRIKRGKAGKLTVKLFVDRDNYHQTSGAGPNTLGFFRFIEPYQLNIFYDRLDPKATEEILFHELGHYLQKLIDVDFEYPHWPGEALSEYYGASSWDPVKKKVHVGKILAGRAEEIRYGIATDERVTIRELLERAPDRVYHDYTWGWSLVHFLMTDKKHAKNFSKFYVALAKGKDIDRHPKSFGRTVLKALTGKSVFEAFHKYMKIKDDAALNELQGDWYDHIENNLNDKSNRGLENAAFKSLLRGRKLRAKRMLEEAIAGGTKNSLTYYRYAELLKDLKEGKKAREFWEKAIEHDPLVPGYYIGLGKYLVELGTEEGLAEGEECLRLALDIEPENFYLERNLERILRSGRKKLEKSAAMVGGGGQDG